VSLEDIVRQIVRDELAKASPGRSIRERRIAQGITLGELSERSGVNIATLSKLETGKTKNPRKHVLERISSVIGLNNAPA
jgi:transcriptional regulator with XRE-family HTH domain